MKLKTWRSVIPLTGKLHSDRLKGMAAQIDNQLNGALETAQQNRLTIKRFHLWMDGSNLNIVVEAI